MNLLDFFEKTIVVTGHYGAGKTNLSINLAVDLKKRGEDITLADLDIVNPYFRSADFKTGAMEQEIGFIVSDYANTNVDIPAINPALEAKISLPGILLIDVGGDDAGARALGGYAQRIMEKPYTMLYVVNARRYLIREASAAAALLAEIEAASRMKATHIVNNTHLAAETSAADVLASAAYAKNIAEAAGIPLAFTSVRRDLYESLPDKTGYHPVDIYVKTPWM